MSVKIAVIGANEQQNPLILKARERGYETHTFSWEDGSEIGRETSDYFYPISVSSKAEILARCREIGIDAVVSIGSDMSALTAAYVADAMGLGGNSYESVRRATDKTLTRKIFAEHNIDQPKFVEIGDSIDFDALKKMTYPLIVKPGDRSGSRGIRVIRDESGFFGAINEARDLAFERKALVEEYIDGKMYSCECISIGGEHKIVGYTERSIALVNSRPCEYRHFQPAILPRSIITKIENEVPRALDALGLTDGASSVEFIVDENNDLFFIEISPYLYGDYIGTHLLPAVYGADLTGAVLDIALKQDVEPSFRDTGLAAEVNFDYSSAEGVRYGHTFTRHPIKAYGGCPAFKLNRGTPYYREDEQTVALNSEYSALRYALTLTDATRVHIPYYAPNSYSKIAEDMGLECVYYHIGEDFSPLDINAADSDAVLLINYHGLCSERFKKYTVGKRIIDNSMSFFTKPVMEEGVYNIYSARKFFAVPDGAYLISSSISQNDKIRLPKDVSYKRATAHLKSLELGEGSAYKDMQTNEQEIAKAYCTMSALTESLLSAVDYVSEDSLRTECFRLLHEHLGKYNLLKADLHPDHAPQFYPLLVNSDVRDYLIGKKIFVPLMWRKTLSAEFNSLPEKHFSQRLICLPISPEYSTQDIEYIAKTVIASLT